MCRGGVKAADSPQFFAFSQIHIPTLVRVPYMLLVGYANRELNSYHK